MAAKVRLIWTAPALNDLDDIAAWITVDDENAAQTLVARVLEGVERWQRFPLSGRWATELPGRIYREVVIPPCRVIYRREGSSVLVVHVMREEQQLRSERVR